MSPPNSTPSARSRRERGWPPNSENRFRSGGLSLSHCALRHRGASSSIVVRIVVAARRHRVDASVRTMRLVARPRGEKQRVDRLTGKSVAERDAPEPVDLQRLVLCIAQSAKRRAGLEVIGVDAAITEVADEQAAAETAEAGRCQCHAPRRVELAARSNAMQQLAVRIVDVHIAQTAAVDV